MKEYFYTITEGMINLGLRGTELNLFAIIFGYSQKGDGCCYATRKELARRCGVSSERTIDSAIDSLMGKGLIRKMVFGKDGREMVAYSYSANSAQGAQKLQGGCANSAQGGCANSAHMKKKDKETQLENIPPTPQAVAAYARQLGAADPEGFADYYIKCQTEMQWRTKSGKEITNWKLNVIQWLRYHKNESFPKPAQAYNEITDIKAFMQ